MASAHSWDPALSVVNQEFAPLVPALNEAFKKIWTPHDIPQLRGNFNGSRVKIPFVPEEGFVVSHRMIPVSDGSEIEIRIYQPMRSAAVKGLGIPYMFVAHGGGKREPDPKSCLAGGMGSNTLYC
ncbi:hypothetical protein BDV06DRAFT_225204 [Aspergillus oleicola]